MTTSEAALSDGFWGICRRTNDSIFLDLNREEPRKGIYTCNGRDETDRKFRVSPVISSEITKSVHETD